VWPETSSQGLDEQARVAFPIKEVWAQWPLDDVVFNMWDGITSHSTLFGWTISRMWAVASKQVVEAKETLKRRFKIKDVREVSIYFGIPVL